MSTEEKLRYWYAENEGTFSDDDMLKSLAEAIDVLESIKEKPRAYDGIRQCVLVLSKIKERHGL